MVALTLRVPTGRRLTPAEIDGNFIALNDAVEVLDGISTALDDGDKGDVVLSGLGTIWTTKYVTVDAPKTLSLVGENVLPDRWHDAGAPLIKGEYLTLVGDDILTTTDAKASASVLIGPWTGILAGGIGLYGVEAMGFRTIENLADGQYVTALSIDVFKTATYGRNSVGVGAKSGLYKTDVQGVTLLGVSSAYAPGVISNSLIAGAQAADGFASAVTVYNFANTVSLGPFCGRGLNAPNNTLGGANVASLNDIIGVANAIWGRAGLFALRNGTGNTSVGDSNASNMTDGNFNFLGGYGLAPSLVNGSGNILLGNGLDVPTSSTSNYINIGGAITGSSSTFALTLPGSITIGKKVMRSITRVFGLPSGLNSDIAIGDWRYYIIGSAGGSHSIGGFTGGVDGQEITIINHSTLAQTIVQEDVSSTAINRINTITGANMVLAGRCSATFVYLSATFRWQMVHYSQ